MLNSSIKRKNSKAVHTIIPFVSYYNEMENIFKEKKYFKGKKVQGRGTQMIIFLTYNNVGINFSTDLSKYTEQTKNF